MKIARSAALAVLAAVFSAASLAACAKSPAAKPDGPGAGDDAALLDAAINGDQRTAEEKARDQWRHPKETLEFFGIEPSMTVVEIWPGGGWYTKILAPYLHSGGGQYSAAQVDPAGSERAAAAVQRFKDAYGDEAVYGKIDVTALGAGDIAPPGTADAVLTFRNVHNWLAAGAAEQNFAAFFAALKPGGVLGVVEHRANEDASDADGSSGYVKTSTVKKLAEDAGFKFVAESEINANPKDTKDHPFGVWTLPPVRRSSASAGEDPPEGFDRAKYDAIGESDRMTLKFIKPAS